CSSGPSSTSRADGLRHRQDHRGLRVGGQTGVTTPAPPPGRDASMSVGRANLIALFWLPIAALLALGPFILRWGTAPLAASIPPPSQLPLVLIVLLVSVLLHELVHGAGFLLLR